jgi:hypothetical protein
MEVLARSWFVSVVMWTSLAALTAACGSAAESTAGSGGVSETEAGTSAKTSARGDAAVWVLKPDQSLHRSSTTFTALVSRLGCNNGVTGQVLAPEIHASDSEVVVTFSVAAKQPGPATCPGNDQVSYEVDLGERLQGRALIDGQCLPGEDAATTAWCSPDATRFRP